MTVLTGDTDKGEINSMCDVLDAIEKKGFDTGYGSGYNEGEASQAKKDAVGMYRKGLDTTDIAEITGNSTETILGWLDEAGVL